MGIALEYSNPANYQKCVKKSYNVKMYIPPIGTKVYNKLEDVTYTTSIDSPYVLVGTVGEEWVVNFSSLCKTYTVLDSGKDITADDVKMIMENGSYLDLKTKSSEVLYFCYQVPLSYKFKIQTSWGAVLSGNRDGIEHGSGDYIVCYCDNDGKPNLSDRWIVNGAVFDSTYTIL